MDLLTNHPLRKGTGILPAVCIFSGVIYQSLKDVEFKVL